MNCLYKKITLVLITLIGSATAVYANDEENESSPATYSKFIESLSENQKAMLENLLQITSSSSNEEQAWEEVDVKLKEALIKKVSQKGPPTHPY